MTRTSPKTIMKTVFLAAPLSMLLTSMAVAQPLHNNGAVSNSLGTGFGGADESVLDLNLGEQDLGFINGPMPFDHRVADEFVVPGPENWSVEEAVLYGYQEAIDERGETSTLTSYDVRIWNGLPGAPGSSVVFSTSGLDSSLFSGIYRVTSATSGANNRPIMESRVAMGVSLPPGTYWLDWQTEGTIVGNGPFVPPLPTLPGRGGPAFTGDALMFSTNTGWGPLVDSQNGANKGLPFILEGTVGPPPNPIPSNATWAMAVMALATLGAAVWLLRR